jgi:choline-sulfatase
VFILGLAALGTGLAAMGGWRYARASAPLSGPIIVISIDSLRADHLPPYGYAGVRTPAISALAADGVLFERAYAHAPLTLPAHVAILTGRLPFETGVRDDVGFTVKAGERLLPTLLRERGYATAGVVSSSLLRRSTGIAQGFDFFDDQIPMGIIGGGTNQMMRDGSKSEAIAERWLASIGSSRAFLFLHINEPHKPYVPPERFSDYSPYDGEVAYSDEIVGQLVRYLKSHQLYDRSTIVVLADHGEGLGDHGEQEHGLFLYDEAIHVPLIVKQESNAGAGRRVADVVQQIDLAPTILDLVKAPIPGGLRGRSLKPMLDDTGRLQAPAVYSEALYGRHLFAWSGLTALTDERYRYINAPREELYEIQSDPRQVRNVADDRREISQAMRAALGAFEGPVRKADASRPDPKDKREVLETYRAAMERADERRWPEAIALLQEALRDDPEVPELWHQLGDAAFRLDRLDLAVDAYRHQSELKPDDPQGYLRLASALLRQRKLEEARAQAARAVELMSPKDQQSRADGHELLARIALARHDADTARQEAELAREIEPTRPVPSFVESRLLYDQGKFADALPLFEQALATEEKSNSRPVADLHYLAADTYQRLQRGEEAEAQLIAELRAFPHNVRARADLALLYHSTGRPDAAATAIGELTDITPTPESFALAARLWTTVGNRLQADAIRADSRLRFGPPPRRSDVVQ